MSKLSHSEFSELVKMLLNLSRYDLKRLLSIGREEFGRKTNTINSVFKDGKCRFRDVKCSAIKELTKLGSLNPTNLTLKDGRYLIVGDSHGKHTTRGMFRLLNNLNNHLNFKNIIHIGHILDDDNDISYLWKDFDNLIVLSKEEEAKEIEAKKENYGYKVVNGSIFIGDFKICNQEMIGDYVRTNLGNLDPYIFNTNSILNSHRHELDHKGCYQKVISFASPGCLCERHIVTTIKQIDFMDGRQVKESYPCSYKKYRTRKTMTEYWEQGAIILELIDNTVSIHPIRIKKIGDEYITSYYDKIYINDRIEKPENRIFFNSDVHADRHDVNVIDLQDQFVKRYNPNIYVNLGDMVNNKSLNHHEIDKGYFIQKQFLDEFKSYCLLLDIMSKWSKENHIIFGNHERFMNDFSNKYPQLLSLFEFLYNNPLDFYKYIKHGLKEVFEVGGVKFLHGDLKLFGQSGSFIEKVAKTFGADTVIGHLHVNCIRYGCYIVGLSGTYDQEYNDVQGSRWTQGFGFCNQYKGLDFIQLVNINKDYTFSINGRKFIAREEKPLFNKKININLSIR